MEHVMKIEYLMKIELQYILDAYEQVTLKERLQREIQSFLDDKDAKVSYLAKDEE